MIQTIKKRDGKEVEFDKNKIVSAITKAMQSTEKGENIEISTRIADKIEEKFISSKALNSVEGIHDEVERLLMASSRKDVAKEYITYRHKRDVARQAKTRDVFLEIVNAKATEVTRENANMNTDTPAGMMMKFASETTKPFVGDYLLSDEAREAHSKGYIHIHDMDYYPTKSLTCVHHPLDKILKYGFSAGHGAARPAKRIETASILGCISMETTQNEMHGGQSIPAFDFYLAPFVRLTLIEEIKKLEEYECEDYSELYQTVISDYIKSDVPTTGTKLQKIRQQAINRTVERVHQSMEAFIHNMNTIHSRGGNQVVFSSINYGTDTSPEGRCIIRELLLTTYRGVGNNETPIFPIQIWKKKRGVSYLPQDKNYDLYRLACKVTAKRFFPNFINLDATFNVDDRWDENDPERYKYEVATMGCRTRVFENRFGEKTSIGRGNLSFTSINLVRLALECRHIESEVDRIYEFIGKLQHYAQVAARQLKDRYCFQKTALAKQFPLLMSSIWQGCDNLNRDDTIESVMNQGTLTIGFVGLAECLKALIGVHHGESEEAQELGVEIIRHLKECADNAAEEHQHNFGVLATPAESLCGRFVAIDRKEYGAINGITDRNYYTNSNHVPVYFKCTAEHKARIEAPYHEFTKAGHIFYVELDGDATHNIESIMSVVDLIDKYNIGYGSINHNRNRCLDCSFENSQKEMTTCPSCGSQDIDCLQRITGYLVGTTNRWNNAKLSELGDRVKHGV